MLSEGDNINEGTGMNLKHVHGKGPATLLWSPSHAHSHFNVFRLQKRMPIPRQYSFKKQNLEH